MLNFNGGLTINVNEWAGMQAEQKGGEIYAHVGQRRSFFTLLEGILQKLTQFPSLNIEENTTFFDLTFLPLNFRLQNFAG